MQIKASDIKLGQRISYYATDFLICPAQLKESKGLLSSTVLDIRKKDGRIMFKVVGGWLKVKSTEDLVTLDLHSREDIKQRVGSSRGATFTFNGRTVGIE